RFLETGQIILINTGPRCATRGDGLESVRQSDCLDRSSARGCSLQHLMDFVSGSAPKSDLFAMFWTLSLRARAGKMRRIPRLTNGCNFSQPMPPRSVELLDSRPSLNHILSAEFS